MKYYEVETPDGPLLVGTQADAKALKMPFTVHEVPNTDKAKLMAYINDLKKLPKVETGDYVEPQPSVAREILADLDKPKDNTIKTPPTPEEVEDFILASEGSDLRMVFECLVEKLNRKIKKGNVDGDS